MFCLIIILLVLEFYCVIVDEISSLKFYLYFVYDIVILKMWRCGCYFVNNFILFGYLLFIIG